MEKAAPCGPFLQGSVLILKRFYQRELSESSSRYARMPKRFKPHPYQTGSNTALYITRARSVTCSISSSFGTRPNSFCSATATLAFKSLFFCSLLMIQKYQNALSMSSFGTLILERVLEH